MSLDINKIGEETIKEIREILKEKYPKLRIYLQNNQPELVKLYDYYYEQSMTAQWQVAVEYAYRILRLYVQVRP
jgi:hypothetical protein